MMDIEQYLTGTFILVAIWGGSALWAVHGFRQLFLCLRERHPALWHELGEPTAMIRVKAEHSVRLRAMVAKGASYETDDEQLRGHLVRLSKVLLVSRVTSAIWAIWTLALLVDIDPS